MVGKYEYIHTPVNQLLKYAVKICLSKRIPFTFDHHICDLPQHPLKLISAPQVKKPWTRVSKSKRSSQELLNLVDFMYHYDLQLSKVWRSSYITWKGRKTLKLKKVLFCHYLKISILDIAWFGLTMVIYM